MPRETVLVVEDSPTHLKLTRLILMQAGYAVSTAASAEEALDLLAGLHPALILLDLQLPGMDGLELTRYLRQDPSYDDVVIVALTAAAMKGDDTRAVAAGCDGYIAKPVDTRKLAEQVRGFLGKRRVLMDEAFPAPEAAQPPASGSAAGPVPDSRETILADLEVLRKRFLAEGVEETGRILKSWGPTADIAAARRLFHQWLGTGGLLGFEEISTLAGETNRLMAGEDVLMNPLAYQRLEALAAAFAAALGQAAPEIERAAPASAETDPWGWE